MPHSETETQVEVDSNLAVIEPEQAPEAPATFEDLDLSPVMRRALKKLGYDQPSPIQAQVI
ncbi:MAG: DEAD/DEAH box helicase, partial [bacterium]|nr:DEAD/DEAH box helicase [bacterium]